jgi:ABC-type branched-subunit amino acid transport system substrate-binding protein
MPPSTEYSKYKKNIISNIYHPDLITFIREANNTQLQLQQLQLQQLQLQQLQLQQLQLTIRDKA